MSNVHLLNKMKNLFLKTRSSESEKIDLDNLDRAKLVRVGNAVEVENEHGSRYPITELSDDEASIFIYLLEH